MGPFHCPSHTPDHERICNGEVEGGCGRVLVRRRRRRKGGGKGREEKEDVGRRKKK